MNFCKFFPKWKIKFISENYDGQNCLVESSFTGHAISGIEHDNFLRMLTL